MSISLNATNCRYLLGSARYPIGNRPLLQIFLRMHSQKYPARSQLSSCRSNLTHGLPAKAGNSLGTTCLVASCCEFGPQNSCRPTISLAMEMAESVQASEAVGKDWGSIGDMIGANRKETAWETVCTELGLEWA